MFESLPRPSSPSDVLQLQGEENDTVALNKQPSLVRRILFPYPKFLLAYDLVKGQYRDTNTQQ